MLTALVAFTLLFSVATLFVSVKTFLAVLELLESLLSDTSLEQRQQEEQGLHPLELDLKRLRETQYSPKKAIGHVNSRRR
jgi:hypothetical protein